MTAALCVGAGLAATAAEGQQAVPSLAIGVPVTILPLQNAVPAPSGAWPGGARSLQATVDAFDAEVDFALSEKRSTQTWTGPGKVVKAAARNPLLNVDPERLAYEGLDATGSYGLKGILYEPLQGQLRNLTALLGTRLVVLPMRLSYLVPAEKGDSGGSDRPPVAAPGQVAVRLAIVDTRAGQVMWRGWVTGPPSKADAAGALAGLAGRLVAWLAP